MYVVYEVFSGVSVPVLDFASEAEALAWIAEEGESFLTYVVEFVSAAIVADPEFYASA